MRNTRQDVRDFIRLAETNGRRAREKHLALVHLDEKLKDQRPWMIKVMEDAEKLEQRRTTLEQKRRRNSLTMRPSFADTKFIDDAYMIYFLNEHLDETKGKLKFPWVQKKDTTTGRYYYKNVETKTTSWVDPRTHASRKHDPLDCPNNPDTPKLPFGYDKAITKTGVVFYINHLAPNYQHHKQHPHDLILELQQQLAVSKEELQENEAIALPKIGRLRDKEVLLTTQLQETTNVEARRKMEDRVSDLADTIRQHTHHLTKSREEVEKLERKIEWMRSRKPLSILTDPESGSFQ